MLDVKVAGPGCKNCHEVRARVERVLAELGEEAPVHELKGYAEIAASGVMMTPGLIVGGKVVSQGKIPTEEQIRGWLREALAP